MVASLGLSTELLYVDQGWYWDGNTISVSNQPTTQQHHNTRCDGQTDEQTLLGSITAPCVCISHVGVMVLVCLRLAIHVRPIVRNMRRCALDCVAAAGVEKWRSHRIPLNMHKVSPALQGSQYPLLILTAITSVRAYAFSDFKSRVFAFFFNWHFKNVKSRQQKFRPQNFKKSSQLRFCFTRFYYYSVIICFYCYGYTTFHVVE